MYTGWVNEEDEYVQGRGGEGLRLGNLEDEDGNRDNNEGREWKGGTTTTPSMEKIRRGRTIRCQKQPRQPTTTTSSPPDGFELGTNVGKKLGFFDGKVLGTTLGVADVITIDID